MNTTGIGLGLVISESIVKEFGGSVAVESKHKHGSNFSFSILLGEDKDHIQNEMQKNLIMS